MFCHTRDEKLAQRLRDNLLRRKEQKRLRNEVSAEAQGGEPDHENLQENRKNDSEGDSGEEILTKR